MIQRLLVLTYFLSNVVCANTIELFTLSKMPFENTNIEVCLIDGGINIEREINNRLKEIRNHDEVQNILNNEIQSKIFKVNECRARAGVLRISKVPAIVIDGMYVVYGERNIVNALNLIKEQSNA